MDFAFYPAQGIVFNASADSGNYVQATATIAGTNVTGTIASNAISLSVAPQATMSNYFFPPNFPSFGFGAAGITQSSGSSVYVCPIILPQAVSLSYARFLVSFNDSAVGTGGTTSANTTFSCERYTTYGLVIYSQGAGASSRSIQSVGATTVGMTGRTIYSAGAQGSQYTVTLQKTYPDIGNTTNSYTTSYAVSSASIVISSDSNTLFTGPRFLDLAWATSFSAGNYWFGIGASTSSASNSSNISFVGTNALMISLGAMTMNAASVGRLGNATSASDNQWIQGLGIWTTNASLISTGSIALGAISQVVSNPMVPIQFIRQV